jgi:hypothetical protein
MFQQARMVQQAGPVMTMTQRMPQFAPYTGGAVMLGGSVAGDSYTPSIAIGDYAYAEDM